MARLLASDHNFWHLTEKKLSKNPVRNIFQILSRKKTLNGYSKYKFRTMFGLCNVCKVNARVTLKFAANE